MQDVRCFMQYDKESGLLRDGRKLDDAIWIGCRREE